MKDNTTSGVLVVDKPSGITSHDVIDIVRKRFSFKKVGHAGTLDPLATGLLVLLIGKATKLSRTFINDDKTYEAVIKMGIETDTGDAGGRILKRCICQVKEKDIHRAINRFKGRIQQVPPMYSAKRHKGKKLYEYARKGIEIPREPRWVTVRDVQVLGIDGNELSVRITCSKGTFIRQIAADFGREIGCGAHIVRLKRTRSGRLNLNKAVSVCEIRTMDKGDIIRRMSDK